MKQKEVVRAYGFSDADLRVDSGQLKQFVERDATEFATRNEGQATLDAYQVLLDTVETQKTDKELQGPAIAATAFKNQMVEETKTKLRNIRSIAKSVYGEKGLYNSFGFDDMDELSDNKLYYLVLRVYRVGVELLPQMSGKGLSSGLLADLEAQGIKILQSLSAQVNAVAVRDVATQQRIINLNALYTEYARLSNLGKDLFLESDEARYNDYTIFETRSHTDNPTGEPNPDTPPGS